MTVPCIGFGLPANRTRLRSTKARKVDRSPSLGSARRAEGRRLSRETPDSRNGPGLVGCPDSNGVESGSISAVVGTVDFPAVDAGLGETGRILSCRRFRR